jgi:hypothetical protein
MRARHSKSRVFVPLIVGTREAPIGKNHHWAARDRRARRCVIEALELDVFENQVPPQLWNANARFGFSTRNM